MPLYEYRCRKCGHQFELIQKFTDPPMDRCEKCGGAVEKLLSAPGLQFKGSGFYITDYSRKDKEAKSKRDAKPEKPAVPPTTTSTPAPAKESGSSGSGGGSNSGSSTPPPAKPSSTS